MGDKHTKETVFDKLNEEQKTVQIPYYIHEGEMTRLEKVIKRLWIAMVVVFIAFIGTNVGWIIYENQFQEEVYTYEIQQDSGEGGTNTYTGNTVSIAGGDYYGEADNKSFDQEESQEDRR